MYKFFIFLIGVIIGIAFDVVPHAVEVMASTNVCRESCPRLLSAASMVIYLTMPIVWGGVLVVAGDSGRNAIKVICVSTTFSLMLMLSLTWLLHAYQHQVFG